MNAQAATREPVTVVDEVHPAQLPAVRREVLPMRPAPMPYPPKIAAAILAIRREVSPVAKAGENAFHHYKYPKAEDVVDEVIPLLAKHGLAIVQSEVTRTLFENERTLAITYEYIVFNGDGEVWPERPMRTGLGMVRDGKGTVDDKASSKCSTQSEKYFYIKFFGIRTSDAAQTDNDAEPPTPPVQPAAPTRTAEPPAPQEPPTPPEPPCDGLTGAEVEAKAGDVIPPTPAEPAKATTIDHSGGENGGTPKFLDRKKNGVTPKFNHDRWVRGFLSAIKDASTADIDDKHRPAINEVQHHFAAEPAHWTKIVNGLNEAVEAAEKREAEAAKADVFDEAQWLRDLDGALAGCGTAQEVFEVQQTVQKPAATKASKENYHKGKKLVAAALSRIATDED